MNEAAGISNGVMRFQSKELQELFDVQVVRLFDIIDKQIQSFQDKYPTDQIAHLVLSGGLGNSAYVQGPFEGEVRGLHDCFQRNKESAN